jgi:hypothetical protein
MAYRNKTYVAFDGDNDMRAYRMMTAWCEHEHIDFDFHNAHDINKARDMSSEESIKAQLRIRIANSKQMILLVGKNTKYLRKFVPWEIQLARKKDIPIVVVNLNGKREYDSALCPSTVCENNVFTIHVSFNSRIIQYALDEFPDAYKKYKGSREGNWYYNDWVYKKLGL